MRIERKESRIIPRKYAVIAVRMGSETKVSSARRQSSSSIAIEMSTSIAMSPKIDTTPRVTISVSASMSFVMRVMSRPTGLRSKNESDRNCRCRKSSSRRSYIARCPTHVVSSDCAEDEQVENAEKREAREGFVAAELAVHRRDDGLVDDVFRDDRWGDLCERHREQQGERDDHPDHVRTEVADEAPRQLGVVGLPEDLVLLDETSGAVSAAAPAAVPVRHLVLPQLFHAGPRPLETAAL